MKKKCENTLVVLPVRVYYVSVRYKCFKIDFRRGTYVVQQLKKNLGDTTFHTLIFLFLVNDAIQESPLPPGKKTTWPHKSGNFKMLTNYQQS